MKKVIGILFFVIPMILNSQWVQTNGPGVAGVCCMAKSGVNLLAGTTGLYKTTNNGDNWTKISIVNPDPFFQSVIVQDSLILCGTFINHGIYRSNDYGVSWSNIPMNEVFLFGAAISGPYVYFGAGPGGFEGVYRSTDYGLSFNQVTNTGFERVYSIIARGSYVYSGTYFGGLRRSTNYGLNWAQLISPAIWSLVMQGPNMVAGTMYGGSIYVSNDSGYSWREALELNNQNTVYALATNSTFIFAGTDSNGVYLSTNEGSNWTQINEGLTNLDIRSLFIDNNYIFAGMINENYVWRRPLSDFVGLKNEKTNLPSSYHLYQNFPNPFNPSTKIKFDISPSRSKMERGQGGEVKIIIYDILGREVATLVNEKLIPGTYEIEWNGSNFPSGVYYYKHMITDPETSSGLIFSETKKMVLVK